MFPIEFKIYFKLQTKLAVSEKKATDKIIKGMDGIRNTVERINTVNESKKYRKEQILKYGLPEDKVLLPYGKVGSKEISIYKNIFTDMA